MDWTDPSRDCIKRAGRFWGHIMDLATRLTELQKRTLEHREVLLTEEAAKTALVMPFLQALGYDVFNPSEVVPEFTADVGTKKGEKVDYAIRSGGKVVILIECKPSSAELNLNHAGQLFRYFSVTDARLAILTNGVSYQFYSDVEKPNKMDEKPFFSFSMDAIKSTDVKTLEKFAKATFDIDKIVQEAGNLKVQSLIRKELEREFAEPSEEFVSMLARRVHEGRITPAVKESFSKLLARPSGPSSETWSTTASPLPSMPPTQSTPQWSRPNRSRPSRGWSRRPRRSPGSTSCRPSPRSWFTRAGSCCATLSPTRRSSWTTTTARPWRGSTSTA
jgi:hypothetical protein